jgi:hypothetical protein
MAARDERNRNNRAKVTTKSTRTRVIDGGSRTQQVKGAFDESTGMFIAEYGGEYAKQTADGGFQTLEGGRTASLGGQASVDGMGFKGTSMFSPYGGPSEGNYLNVTVDNPDKRVSETVSSSRMQALDKRSGGDDAQQNRKLKTQREGRSKLRIKASSDGSAGRLKGGPNSDRKRNKLNIDVQGAGSGGVGLNVPR